MTLDDSLPLLYETLRVACFSVRVAFRRKGVRYRRRTSGDGVMWAIALLFCLLLTVQFLWVFLYVVYLINKVLQVTFVIQKLC
ncbi:MAG: hypothetical protein V7K53_01255 [Nostoc sp.]|uniref:hypothetical protein n=1 Tax=Nostoc sp. TaxID=1180 RepID=UPI002FFC3FBC